MKRNQLLAGILAPVVALTGIGVAIFINRSWWTLTGNAISDLGRVGLPHNWVLNTAFVISALLGIYYAVGLLGESRNRIEKAGICIFAVGLGFLAMIGIFPEGTGPHYYVSWAFFITASIGFLITGVGFWAAGERNAFLFTSALFVTGWCLALWAHGHFKGVAVAEFIGAFTISLWYYATMLNLIKRDG